MQGLKRFKNQEGRKRERGQNLFTLVIFVCLFNVTLVLPTLLYIFLQILYERVRKLYTFLEIHKSLRNARLQI